MDADSIAKREKKAARKAAKESLAAVVERDKNAYKSERAEMRKFHGWACTRAASSSQKPDAQVR